MVLLGLQKDLGTAMVFSAILAGLILLSGISWWIILPVVIAVTVIIGGFLALFYHHMAKIFSMVWGWIPIKLIVFQLG